MRRPRALSLIFVLGFGLVVVWLARNTEWGEVPIPTPLRGEAATNPFYAAQKLLESVGATSERRQSLGPTSTGAIVVLSTWGWDINGARRAELEGWVEAGGRLVVDATLITGSDAFEEWSGIVRERDEPVDPVDEDLFQAPEIVEPCSQMTEVGYENGRDGVERGYYELCNYDRASWLVPADQPLWELRREDYYAQAVRMRVGAGAVTVVNAAPFVYREIFEGDHGELLTAALDLRRGDHVVFMSEADVASLPELVWRYGAPVVVVLLLYVALALWRGALRFGPLVAPPERARRSLAEQIRGTGRFALRVGGGAALTAAARRALHEAAARRIVGYDRLPIMEQAAGVARLAALDAGDLGAAMDPHSARSMELRSKLALLETARRQLVSGSQWSKHGKRI
jgi:hypothetical protein